MDICIGKWIFPNTRTPNFLWRENQIQQNYQALKFQKQTHKRKPKRNEITKAKKAKMTKNQRTGQYTNLYFCWWWPLTSAWYLVLQVSRGYKMVVLTRAPTAPDVASNRDSVSKPICLHKVKVQRCEIWWEWEREQRIRQWKQPCEDESAGFG